MRIILQSDGEYSIAEEQLSATLPDKASMHALPQIALPASAVGSVILTTAHHYRCDLPAMEHVFPNHLGLETIDVGLRFAGFERKELELIAGEHVFVAPPPNT